MGFYYPGDDPGDGGGGLPSVTSTIYILGLRFVNFFAKMSELLDELLGD